MNQSLIDALNNSTNPPRISLSTLRPEVPEDLPDETPIPVLTREGMKPFLLRKWRFYDKLSGGAAAISEPFSFLLAETTSDVIEVNLRLLELWENNKYQRTWIEVFDFPQRFRRPGLLMMGKVLIQEVAGDDATYYTTRIMPLVPRRSSTRATRRRR